MRVLIAEDDPAMGVLLKTGLEEEGCSVVLTADGLKAVEKIRRESFDVLILDVMLPQMDGFAVARTVRREGYETPILFLTARDRVADIVNGLNLGGDDYVVKPFSFEVLTARVRALGRRRSASLPDLLRVGDIYIDTETQEVSRDGQRVRLTPTEFKLLALLAREAGRVVTRERISEELWGEAAVQNNTLDAFVCLLRQKINRDRKQQTIHTIRGVGYCLKFSS
ncbi:MAG TPA: response regulator transcription factor [Bryobacteraceae bacterium]|jgi:two-component system copper resistance phosphate regulon response regulator CusR|nr:response regulator transcription factor [Bryobacteraceae bacterium]